MKAAQKVLIAIFSLMITIPFVNAIPKNQAYVLAIDRKHDHVLTQETLKKGEDFLLVKVNPPNLTPQEIVFQTDKYNLYTTATIKDLEAPKAFSKIWVGKLTSKNMLKVYTLANLGYKSIAIKKNSANQYMFYLKKDHGKEDQVMKVFFVPALNPIYDPNEEYKLRAKKGLSQFPKT